MTQEEIVYPSSSDNQPCDIKEILSHVRVISRQLQFLKFTNIGSENQTKLNKSLNNLQDNIQKYLK